MGRWFESTLLLSELVTPAHEGHGLVGKSREDAYPLGRRSSSRPREPAFRTQVTVDLRACLDYIGVRSPSISAGSWGLPTMIRLPATRVLRWRADGQASNSLCLLNQAQVGTIPWKLGAEPT